MSQDLIHNFALSLEKHTRCDRSGRTQKDHAPQTSCKVLLSQFLV